MNSTANQLTLTVAFLNKCELNVPLYTPYFDSVFFRQFICLYSESVEEQGIVDYIIGSERVNQLDEVLDGARTFTGIVKQLSGKAKAGFNSVKHTIVTSNTTAAVNLVTIIPKTVIAIRLATQVPKLVDKLLVFFNWLLDIVSFSSSMLDLGKIVTMCCNIKSKWNNFSFRKKPTQNQGPDEDVTEHVDEEGLDDLSALSIGAYSSAALAVVMIGGFLFYGRMPVKTETSRMMDHLANKFNNVSKVSNGVRGGVQLFTYLSSMLESITEWLARKFCPSFLGLDIFAENKEKVDQWVRRVNQLDREDTYVRLTMDPQLRDELHHLRDESDQYLKVLQQFPNRNSYINNLFLKTQDKIVKLTNKAAHIQLNCGAKIDPFCFCLYGESGVGKSYLTPELINAIADAEGVAVFQRIYTRAVDEKFWSDYAYQFGVVFDDYGQVTDVKDYDPYFELFAIKSNAPKILAMADVNDKGRIFQSKVIGLSTNVAYPKPKHIAKLDALWRRRDMLINVVKKEGADVTTVEIGNFDHLEFKLMNPCDDTNSQMSNARLTWEQLKAIVIKRAQDHLKRQQLSVAYLNRNEMKQLGTETLNKLLETSLGAHSVVPPIAYNESVEQQGFDDEFPTPRDIMDQMMRKEEFRRVRSIAESYSTQQRPKYIPDQNFVTPSFRNFYYAIQKGSLPKSNGAWYNQITSNLTMFLARLLAFERSPDNPSPHGHYSPFAMGIDMDGFHNIPPWFIQFVEDFDYIHFASHTNSKFLRVKMIVDMIHRLALFGPIYGGVSAERRGLIGRFSNFDTELEDIRWLFDGFQEEECPEYTVQGAFVYVKQHDAFKWCSYAVKGTYYDEANYDRLLSLSFGAPSTSDDQIYVVSDLEGNFPVEEQGLEEDLRNSFSGPECSVPKKTWRNKISNLTTGFKDVMLTTPQRVSNICYKRVTERGQKYSCLEKASIDYRRNGITIEWDEYIQSALDRDIFCNHCAELITAEEEIEVEQVLENYEKSLMGRIVDFWKEHYIAASVLGVLTTIGVVYGGYKLLSGWDEEDTEAEDYFDEADIKKFVKKFHEASDRDGEEMDPVFFKTHVVGSRDEFLKNWEGKVRKPIPAVAEGKEYYRGQTNKAAVKPKALPQVVRSQEQSTPDPNADDIIHHRIFPGMYYVMVLRFDEDEVARVKYQQNAFHLFGKILLLNEHFRRHIQVGDYLLIKRKDEEYMIEFDPNNWISGKQDVALYDCGIQMKTGKDNRKFLIKDADLQYMTNLLTTNVNVDIEGREFYYDGETKANDKRISYTLEPSQVVVRDCWTVAARTSRGQCGGVSIALNPRCPRKIIGIHSAGTHNKARAIVSLVTYEMLENLWKKLPNQISAEDLDESSFIKKSIDVREQSLDVGNFTIERYTIRKQVQPHKTHIVPSLLYDSVFPHETEPSVLSPRDPRLEVKIDPLIAGVKKYGGYYRALPVGFVAAAKENLGLEFMKFKALREPGILSVEEAINGLNIDHYDRLDMKTSPGIPYVFSRPGNESGKAYLFNIDEQSGYATIKSLTLKNEIERRIQSYKAGKRYVTIWSNCLKDERRPIAKIKAGNTRTFMMAPVDYTIVGRMYFLDFNAAFIKGRVYSFHSVGINADSSEWRELFHRLRQNSPYGWDGDYKNWDGFLSPQLMGAAVDLINDWYNDGEENARVRRVMMDEMIHAYSSLRGVIIQKHCGMPSGSFVTAIVNSICNALLLRVVYLETMYTLKAPRRLQSLVSYSTHVAETVFGDDNAVSAKPEVLPYFNQNSMTSVLAKWNITYTSADKVAVESPPFKEVEFLSFLKRGFRFDGRWVLAPIERRTIRELVNWVTDTLDPEEQLKLNIVDALRFMFHYGQGEFNIFRKKVNIALVGIDVQPPPHDYVYFMEEYEETY